MMPKHLQPVRAKRGSTAGQLVYAVGDIHGCYDLLTELLADLAKDWSERAGGRRPVLIFLGDYVDRGADSAKVLEAMVQLQRRSDVQVHLLMGNHEQALLAFLDKPEAGANWLHFGGRQTLTAYGVRPPEPADRPEDYVTARDELLSAMPAAHLRLLQQLELMAFVGDYVFVHAGVRPGKSLSKQSDRDLLWIREGFLDAQGPHEKVVVHGHTWTCDRPDLLEHRIGIDTGAYSTGVLTALRLDNGERCCLQAGRSFERLAARAASAELRIGPP